MNIMGARVACFLDTNQTRLLAAVARLRSPNALCGPVRQKQIAKKFLVTRVVAKRFGMKHHEPQIISTDAIAAELGEWARGYALDQRLSGARVRRDLGWTPKHLDPERDIARLP